MLFFNEKAENEVKAESQIDISVLEEERTGRIYQTILVAVSILAGIKNWGIILFLKVFWSRKTPLKKIAWNLGRSDGHKSSMFMDGFSSYNHQAKYGAAGWRSLKLFYNYEQLEKELCPNLEGLLTRHWMGKMENRKAVTNRLKMVIQHLISAFQEFEEEAEIRILSLASGSAQAVIEAMKRCPHLKIRAILIDLDVGALAEAKSQAREAGLLDRFKFVQGTTTKMEEVAADFQPHIVEMVGFLDYRPKGKAIELLQRIKAILPEGGIFLTANIADNKEKIFLDFVLLWPMIYRTEEELEDILASSGFLEFSLKFEPMGIHGIVYARA